MTPKQELRELCERQAECIIAILGSVYHQQGNHAHPGDETSDRIAGLIGDVVRAATKLLTATPAPTPAPLMKRTAKEVVAEWRNSAVNKDDGELVSRIDYWARTEFCSAPLAAPEREPQMLEGLEKLRQKWDDLADAMDGQHSFDFRCGVQCCEAELGQFIAALAAAPPPASLRAEEK